MYALLHLWINATYFFPPKYNLAYGSIPMFDASRYFEILVSGLTKHHSTVKSSNFRNNVSIFQEHGKNTQI